jgi:Undecaprenyl-phosphate glucose phosphotransferase
MLIIAAGAYGGFVAYNLLAYGNVPDRPDFALASVLVSVLYGGLCLIDNQYDLAGDEWNQHSCSRGLGAIAIAFTLVLAVGFLSDSLKGYSRGAFLTQLAVALTAQLVTRTILWKITETARKHGFLSNASMALVCMPGARASADLRATIAMQREEILRAYDLDGEDGGPDPRARFDERLADIRRECRTLRVDAVLIAFGADNMELVTRVASAFSEMPVRIKLLPIGMADLMHRSCGRAGVVELLCAPWSMRDRVLKRGLDIVSALSLSVVLFPLLLLVAILIKLDSRGPVFFRQTRHGFNNEPIHVLKFRSMTTFDDAPGPFRQCVRGDPRITRIGRILRRTNIDELPQLFNVLKGDMSMVGPRPHAVAHNEMYEGRIRRLWRRHNVKPGITGWAQVNGLRGETDTIEKMEKRVEYDLHYIANWSLVFDLKIMILTLISKHAYSNAY